ncbi:MAG: zinc ribbon domain-containing protein [Clostridia bacterium]|nr:zinc ribbon domain-containing protein [Clostridia bacterium]
MSKFCEHCGSELKDNDKVCPNCGAAVEGKAAKKDVKNANANTEKVEKSNVKTIAIVGGIIVAAIIVIVVIFSLIGGAYKTPIKNYFNGVQKTNAKTYLKAYPEFMRENLEDTYDEEFLEKRKESLEKTYGDNVKLSYKVVDKIKMTKDELDKVKDELKEDYDDEKIKISSGYKVCVKLTVKGSDEKETNFMTLDVLKINGKWSVID